MDVRDTGIGIEADRLGALFQPFTQADSSTTREYGGTGLGLAISRRLAAAMDGQLTASSTVGVGSIFHFEAVLRRSPEQVRARRPDLSHVLLDRRVLVVDDNDTNRHVLRHHLQSWGMQVEDLADPEDALVRIGTEPALDLLILDMHMPRLDGLQLCRAAKRSPLGRDVPAVLLSSLGRQETDGGPPCFAAQLYKPVKPGALHDLLGRVLRTDAAAKVKAAPAVPAAPTHRLRVLVADDNAVNQKVATALLTRLGHLVDLASNGSEAVTAVTERPYDLVLMDVYMPVMGWPGGDPAHPGSSTGGPPADHRSAECWCLRRGAGALPRGRHGVLRRQAGPANRAGDGP